MGSTSLIPSTSAASMQLNAPLRHRPIASTIRTIRTSASTRSPRLDRTGQIVCYETRTYLVLRTLNRAGFAGGSNS